MQDKLIIVSHTINLAPQDCLACKVPEVIGRASLVDFAERSNHASLLEGEGVLSGVSVKCQQSLDDAWANIGVFNNRGDRTLGWFPAEISPDCPRKK